MPVKDFGGVFTRSGTSTYIDVNGVVHDAAPHEIRDNHWINGKRYYLRENLSTNLKFNSENLGINWAIRGAGTFTLNSSIAPDGAMTYDRFNPTANGYAASEAHGVNANGRTFTVSAWIKKTTAGSMNINYGLIATTGAGGDLGCGVQTTVAITEKAQRYTYTATANVVTTSFYSFFQEASGGTQAFEIWGWQVEELDHATSYIRTPGQAAVTRQADVLAFPWTPVPQLMTGMVSGLCLGQVTASGRLFQLSSAHDNNEGRFLVYFPTNPGTLYHQNYPGLTAVTIASSGNISAGDSFEFRAVLRANGSVVTSKTVNGGAETSAGPSATNTLSAIWGDPTFGPASLYLGCAGNGLLGCDFAFSCVRFVKGEQTLDYMRYDFLNAISSDYAEFVHLLEFEFASGTVRLATGVQDLLWNALSWEAVGGLLEIGGIEETTDARAQGVDVRLSGVDQTVLAILLGSSYRGRTVRIYRAHLDKTTGLLVGDPMLLFQGLQLSPYTVDEERTPGGGTVRISTRLSGYFGVERIRGIMSNLVSHQHYFNGDLFFQQAASLANVKIYWGTPVPRTPGSSSGNGGDRGRQCFPAGTLILMADGSEKAIELVAVGDSVAAFDETDGSLQTSRVQGLLRHVAEKLRKVTLGSRVLYSTPEHRVYVRPGFVSVGDLKVGESVWCRAHCGLAPQEVSSIEDLPRKETVVYNLDVDEFHTYVANGVAVHNIKLE
jgi:hypothetical protein